ncbi:hypothetical protein RIR_jg11474.t1 [Rhizophagus irregularis DAOM 181602=DAOM 197198]|nr:hypothetical protein RIR_jg11474.t1 [Rhizophagus irregularis DAOM 181602=DAOM 197198]
MQLYNKKIIVVKNIYFYNKKKIKLMGYGIWIWDMGYGDMGYWIWDMGYGIGILEWDYGIWDGMIGYGMGYGISQSH